MFSCHENFRIICSKHKEVEINYNKYIIIPTTILNHPDINIQHVEHSRQSSGSKKRLTCCKILALHKCHFKLIHDTSVGCLLKKKYIINVFIHVRTFDLFILLNN